jgi:hypothetical protein
MINVDYLETAARHKKEDVQWLMLIILKQQHGIKRIVFIMINVDYVEIAARQKKDNVHND